MEKEEDGTEVNVWDVVRKGGEVRGEEREWAGSIELDKEKWKRAT